VGEFVNKPCGIAKQTKNASPDAHQDKLLWGISNEIAASEPSFVHEDFRKE